MSITKEWAVNYCQRLIKDNNLSYPFTLGRKKQGGYVDSSAHIRSSIPWNCVYRMIWMNGLHNVCLVVIMKEKLSCNREGFSFF